MTETKILSRLTEFGPRVIEQFSKPGPRCVLATRVGMETLRRFGIDADCAPVILDVANTEFLEWVAAGHPDGADGFRARGAWLVTNNPVKFEAELASESARQLSERERWPGHLVVTARGLLIDLDLQQTARPRHHISPPGGLAVRWDGLGAVADFRWGCVRYRPWPPLAPLPEFRHSTDWRGNVDPVVDLIVRAIRKGTL